MAVMRDSETVAMKSRPLDAIKSRLPMLAFLLLLLVPLALMNVDSWLVLTLAGFAMGMMIFIMASGLTLVFGLMDVLNFGHGAFITVGAYIATLVLLPMSGWVASPSFFANMVALGAAIVVATAVAGALGYVFERVIIRPVYGQHLKQILVTMGGLIVAEQLIIALWGPDQIPLPRPESLRGSFTFGNVVVEKYRLVAVVIGTLVLGGMLLVLNRTKAGLLIRAGVENAEMVEALGYRIRRLFVAVFVAGSALAGLGGVMWALYQEVVTVNMGMEVTVLVFIVIIIGGLGSIGGCFIGAVLVGLVSNYTNFLAPVVGNFATIALMVVVLMWRPQGLFPVAKR